MIRQWGQEGWKQANERKGIAYLSSRNSISSVRFMVMARSVRSVSWRVSEGELAVRRDHRRVLEGRGRCLDFMICD